MEFKVTAYAHYTYTIEADNEQDAIDKAKDQLNDFFDEGGSAEALQWTAEKQS